MFFGLPALAKEVLGRWPTRRQRDTIMELLFSQKITRASEPTVCGRGPRSDFAAEFGFCKQ
jgi:hypothetical protein